MQFDQGTLAELDGTRNIRIETSTPGGPLHSTIIWVVVDGSDVFVRSWLGERARWYREARANPDVTLVVGRRRLAARAVLAADPDSVRRCSEGILAKYAASTSAQSMVVPEILATTLRLDPS